MPPVISGGIGNVGCVTVGIKLEFIVHVRGRVYHTAETALRIVHIFLPLTRGVGGTKREVVGRVGVRDGGGVGVDFGKTVTC